MTNKNTIISPIAIDMGAKNTGVYFNHFNEGELSSSNEINIKGTTLVIDSNKITWSQIDRTQKRHQIRNNKRKKLSKRLLKIILGNRYKVNYKNMNYKVIEYINGMLNRRGFTYLAEGLDENLIKNELVASYFVENYEYFNNEELFFQDFIKVTNNLDKTKQLFSMLSKTPTEFKNSLDFEKDAKDILTKAYSNIKNTLELQINSEQNGHKRREIYFANIKKDIKNEILKPIFSKELTVSKLYHLIANISNLQLKPLRKYFNDRDMLKGDLWKPEKLHKIYFRWIMSFRPKLIDEKLFQQKLLKLIKINTDIIELLTTTNPELSIPPYEDQNNRTKDSTKDKTLRLNAQKLETQFFGWENIVQKLQNNYCEPTTNINVTTKVSIDKDIIESTHKKINSIQGYNLDKQINANILQRIFDRSMALDPYKIRLLCTISDLTNTKEDAKISHDLLHKHLLSHENIEQFLSVARRYYKEVEVAKQGLWTENTDSLLFCCNTNPPQKSNLAHKLVGHIVQENLTTDDLALFKKEFWNKKIKGNSTGKSLAEKIENARKEYGNAFNYILQKLKRFQWSLENKKSEISNEQNTAMQSFVKAHKDIATALKNTTLVAEHIAKYFDHDSDTKDKYNNPFSIAQIYNILETNIGGFSKTDKFNSEENAWRNQQYKLDETISSANAVRLAADSIRPFDGMLARILERQAFEIAKDKINHIDSIGINNGDNLFIPIFLEQNRFKFEQSLHDVKGSIVSKKSKDNAKKSLERQEGFWQEKSKRIKDASKNICPYNGTSLSDLGQTDHIIPQASSKKNRDTVYNSEANLIYCSTKGNTDKSDKRYNLENLKSNYLQQVFGHSDTSLITSEISKYVKSIDKNNYQGFHNLDRKQQNLLRHALFISELDAYTFPLLNTRSKTFVNGTQAYLGKLITQKLREHYPQAQFKVYQVDAYEAQQTRNTLATANEQYKKQEIQGAFSHVIDATMVYATALQQMKISDDLKTLNSTELCENGDWLSQIIPDSGQIIYIESKPKYRKDLSSTQIFKEGIYGERFIPLLMDGNYLYKGFSLDNCEAIKTKIAEKTFNTLKPFLMISNRQGKKIFREPITQNYEYYQNIGLYKTINQPHKKYLHLSIDKKKALKLLQRAAKENTEEIVQQAKELELLRYTILKKEIKSQLFVGSTNRNFIKNLNPKHFKIGKLTLPAKDDWQRLIQIPIKDHECIVTTIEKCFGMKEQTLIDDPEINLFWQELQNQTEIDMYSLEGLLEVKDRIISKANFEKAIKEKPELGELAELDIIKDNFGKPLFLKKDLIPEDSWDTLFEQFFHKDKIKNHSNHKQVRKEYSLPIIASASGGFRVKRKNPSTLEDIYQVSCINDFKYSGLTHDFSDEVIIPDLMKSNNVSPIKHLYDEKIDFDNFFYFDEWRKIKVESENIYELHLAPGSKPSMDVRIIISMQLFKELLEQFAPQINPEQPPSSAISLSFSLNDPDENLKIKECKSWFANNNIPPPKSEKVRNATYKFRGFRAKLLANGVELSYKSPHNIPFGKMYLKGISVN